MTDKYQVKQSTLYRGDCFEVLKSLPDESVDAVVTDPPYGILKHKIETGIDIPRFLQECYRILKPNCFLIYFGRQPTLTLWNTEAFKLFRYKNEVIWYKRFRSSPMGDMGRVYENIMIVCKGDNKRFNETRIPYLDFIESMADITNLSGIKGAFNKVITPYRDKMKYEEALRYLEAKQNNTSIKQFLIEDFSRNNEQNASFNKQRRMKRVPANTIVLGAVVMGKPPQNLVSFLPHNLVGYDPSGEGKGEYNIKHPTVKPIKLMEWLADLTTKPGEVIIDPFMGSGTTGLACQNLGRDFIGIELDPGYFEIARQRIATGTVDDASETDVTSNETPSPKQYRLL
jgi:site-specific DNA-methyltransferase (adenine-specific)